MDALVHRFADPIDEARARAWLGGKGASLAEMTRMGLPVPPGFTLSVELWRLFEVAGALPAGLEEIVRGEVARLESATGLRLGDANGPLLLAVRSGSATSMPGMLDTVLDVGVTPEVAGGLAALHGAPRFGLDVRRRFLESYATVVLGVPREAFDAVLARRDARSLDEGALEALLAEYERLVRHEAGAAVPDDPWEQVMRSIEGVLRSWRGPRARQYREAHGVDHDEGTAVTLQAMVYGNAGPRSGAGVAFTRNPTTGERALWGEWLVEAQGEDIVSGRRTPLPLSRAQVRTGQTDHSLETAMPEVHAELRSIGERLEARYGDAQDVELTIERGRLYLLQARPAKRTARAAARIAVEMVEEKLIATDEALGRIEPASLRQLLVPRVPDPQALAAQGLAPLARGLAASPGAAVGRVVLDAAAAASFAGDDRVLVRSETSPEDVETMRVVGGVLTAAGGLTSHAAVVARAMGKPCVAGAASLHVDYARRLFVARTDRGPVEVREGDVITIDGSRGLVYAAAAPVEPAPASEHVEAVLRWADARRAVRVLAEAPTERLAHVGIRFGADGILATDADVAAMLAAVGEGVLWYVATTEEAARAALSRLRPNRDVLVATGSVHAAAAARGVLVGASSGASSDGLATVLRGEAATRVEAIRALRPAALAVPPLDVPVARLCAARAAIG